jgi:transcriptional regulator with XRE-family HTH domain
MKPIEVLRQKRAAGMTLGEIAGEAGCSISYIADILKGRRAPAGKVLKYLGFKRVTTYVKG